MKGLENARPPAQNRRRATRTLSPLLLASIAFWSNSPFFLSIFFDSRSSCLAVNFIWNMVLSMADAILLGIVLPLSQGFPDEEGRTVVCDATPVGGRGGL